MIILITASNQVLKTALKVTSMPYTTNKMIHEPSIKKTATRLPFMSSQSVVSRL